MSENEPKRTDSDKATFVPSRVRELNHREDVPAGLIQSSCARVLVDDLIDEVERLRSVIQTGGAMYRAERASMGIPGGLDPNDLRATLANVAVDRAKEIVSRFGTKPRDLRIEQVEAPDGGWIVLVSYERAERQRTSDATPDPVKRLCNCGSNGGTNRDEHWPWCATLEQRHAVRVSAEAKPIPPILVSEGQAVELAWECVRRKPASLEECRRLVAELLRTVG